MSAYDHFIFILIIICVEFVILEFINQLDLTIFNPFRNYEKWNSMNWFGVIFFTVVLNIIFPVLSICYWFYKLCTYGRK